MSITRDNSPIRLWNDIDLRIIKKGTDLFLCTIFMNNKTFTKDEIKVYPYHLRHTFSIEFNNNDIHTVYATDLANLKKFLEAEYHTEHITSIYEIKTEVTAVIIDFN